MRRKWIPREQYLAQQRFNRFSGRKPKKVPVWPRGVNTPELRWNVIVEELKALNLKNFEQIVQGLKSEVFPWIKSNKPRWKISQYAQTLARKWETQMKGETLSSFMQKRAVYTENPIQKRRWWDV